MADQEEVVELDMPRPRSLSRKPDTRRAEAQVAPGPASPQTAPPKRRESDAQRMQAQSLQADNVALDNITKEVEAQADASGAPAHAKSLQPDEQDERSKYDATLSEGGTGSRDQDFHIRMNAVSAAEIEEIQHAIRSDATSSIKQESMPIHEPTEGDYEASREPEEAPASSNGKVESDTLPTDSETQRDVTSELVEMMSNLQHNPTYDQQYTMHQGSRGISPPPGFEDSAVPAYHDSSAVPSYQNVFSQPTSSMPANVQPNGVAYPEADRPAMTDKFMNAHIARHGAGSLSPLALLTPDQADLLPEYAQSIAMPEEIQVIRGRMPQQRPLADSAEGREAAKALEALQAVRDIEEREALEAIEGAEALRSALSHTTFSPEQLAAIQSMGDDPSDYISPEEMAQYERLASEAEDDTGNDEAELLQMMAQYMRQPSAEEEASQTIALDSRSDAEDLEDMLRDRLLTKNNGTNSQDPSFDFVPSASLPQVLESHPASRSGVDVYAVLEHAIERSSGTPEVASSKTNPAAEDDHQAQAQSSAAFGGGHGVKKTMLDPATFAAQKARNAKKAEAYADLANQVTALRQQNSQTQAAFDLTTKLLMLNPEYYTIWNYRREIMLGGLFPVLDETAKQDLLSSELKRLQGILQEYPKVYWIWNHRKWCLAQCPWPDWSRELLLVSRMLEQDARNFHVWEYRRYVVAQMESEEESSKAHPEFEYTTAAINSNFSNFSAWHNRTKLIPQILHQIEDDASRETKRQELLQQELELIKGAIYTDPDDQSVWLYHRWLLNPDSMQAVSHPLAPVSRDEHIEQLISELAMIEELMEEEPDNIWCTYAKVHYSLSLSRLNDKDMEKEEADEIQRLMQVLEANDTLRSGRYADWQTTTLSKEKSHVTSSSSDAEFVVFADLKNRSDFNRVTLNDSGIITAHHTTSGSECLIVPDWQAVDKVILASPADKILLVAQRQSDLGFQYYRISKF